MIYELVGGARPSLEPGQVGAERGPPPDDFVLRRSSACFFPDRGLPPDM